MKRFLSGILYLIAVAVSMHSCSDKASEPSIPSSSCYDFATVESKGKDGTVFSLQRSEDSPIIRYKTPYALAGDTSIVVGRRIIIAYNRTDGEPYSSGEINLYGYRLLDNTRQPIGLVPSDSLSRLTSDNLDVSTMSRTGQYINMQLQLSCQQALRPQKLALIIDENAVDKNNPVAYIEYKALGPGLNYFTGYASFDVGEVWSRPSCNSLTICFNTSEGLKSQTFYK